MQTPTAGGLADWHELYPNTKAADGHGHNNDVPPAASSYAPLALGGTPMSSTSGEQNPSFSGQAPTELVSAAVDALTDSQAQTQVNGNGDGIGAEKSALLPASASLPTASIHGAASTSASSSAATPPPPSSVLALPSPLSASADTVAQSPPPPPPQAPASSTASQSSRKRRRANLRYYRSWCK